MCKHRKGWSASEQTRPRATSVDLVYIEKSKENKVVEQQFVEAQITQKGTREEDITKVRVQPSTKV